MNLYLFNDNDSSARFGIGTYLSELTQVLENTDIHVHIVHLHSVRPEFEIVSSTSLTNRIFNGQTGLQGSMTANVENWYIPEVCNQNTFSGPIQKVEYYYRNVIYLLRLHIKDRKNLIFHFNYNQCRTLAKGLKEVFDCRTVTTIHFMKWAFELDGNIEKLRAIKAKDEDKQSPFEQLIYTTDEYECSLYEEVDRVIALSHHAKNLLRNEYHIDANKISVIPNGLADTNLLLDNTGKELAANRLLSNNEPLILFAGHLHPVKGLSYLIKAFRKVLETMPQCRLIIAGSGQYDSYIREAKDICTKVVFAGLLEKKELYMLYQIADVGVIPSLYEAFGYVAVEMMMHGLPVVATVTCGLDEVVNDACGLKVPIIAYPDRVEIDTDLMAEKILYLLKNSSEAKRMGRSGRERFLENYTSEIFRKNMMDLYESLFDDSLQK